MRMTHSKLRKTLPTGVIAPNMQIDTTVVSKATLRRYKRAGLVTHVGGGRHYLTETGARELGWTPGRGQRVFQTGGGFRRLLNWLGINA